MNKKQTTTILKRLHRNLDRADEKYGFQEVPVKVVPEGDIERLLCWRLMENADMLSRYKMNNLYYLELINESIT